MDTEAVSSRTVPQCWHCPGRIEKHHEADCTSLKDAVLVEGLACCWPVLDEVGKWEAGTGQSLLGIVWMWLEKSKSVRVRAVLDAMGRGLLAWRSLAVVFYTEEGNLSLRPEWAPGRPNGRPKPEALPSLPSGSKQLTSSLLCSVPWPGNRPGLVLRDRIRVERPGSASAEHLSTCDSGATPSVWDSFFFCKVG